MHMDKEKPGPEDCQSLKIDNNTDLVTDFSAYGDQVTTHLHFTWKLTV